MAVVKDQANEQEIQMLDSAVTALDAFNETCPSRAIFACLPMAQRLKLLQAVRTLLSRVVDNGNQLSEAITALELDLQHLQGGSVGADLKNPKDNTTIEVKTSAKPKIGNGFETSWVFNAIKMVASREALRDMWMKKCSGSVILEALYNGSLLRRYQLPGPFMASYIANKSFFKGTSRVVNLGCSRCHKCLHYHRILWLLAWSEQWQAAGCPFDEKWFAPINVSIDSQCGSIKNDMIERGRQIAETTQ